jgi:hypothetical protein
MPGNRVFLHVGSPKTGTTFLQQVLWSQRDVAQAHGLLLPLGSFFDHFLASLDLRELADRPEHPARAMGIWDKAVAQTGRWDGNVLISHELFASASEEQAARAIASFGDDREVHVVLTARDLVRQIPAEWQEHLKHRSQKTFDQFVQDLRDDTAGRSWFWRVQDFAEVARRWGQTLPPERVHVVTVPPTDSGPDVLWQRFASLLGLDADAFDLEQSRSNTSLGVEQAELLRRVNAALGDRLPLPGPYAADVKNVFAHRVLAQRAGSRLLLNDDVAEFAMRRSQEIARALEKQQVDVVGDLDELVPALDHSQGVGLGSTNDDVSEAVLLEEAVAALAGLLDEHRARRQERDAERRRLKESPLRFLLIQASERHQGLMRLRRAYQRRQAVTGRLRGNTD